MKNTQIPVLGILGGLGPMSSVYFYEMVTEHTKASCDQEHIDIVLSSHATTPDRTSYLLGTSSQNPVEVMIEDAHKLVQFGANLLVLTCNTAHYFYNQLQEATSVPILNIIKEAIAHVKGIGSQKVGILATTGTIATDTYQTMCDRFGIAYAVPNAVQQEQIMDIIYGSIKSGKPADMNRFLSIVKSLQKAGCDHVILGCTELSLIKKAEHLDSFYVDSLEVLAYQTILACQKEPIGFADFQQQECIL